MHLRIANTDRYARPIKWSCVQRWARIDVVTITVLSRETASQGHVVPLRRFDVIFCIHRGLIDYWTRQTNPLTGRINRWTNQKQPSDGLYQPFSGSESTVGRNKATIGRVKSNQPLDKSNNHWGSNQAFGVPKSKHLACQNHLLDVSK